VEKFWKEDAMRREVSKWVSFGLFLVGPVGANLCAPGYAFGQDRPGRLNVAVRVADKTLKGRPVMVSATGDGKIVTQYEVVLVEPPADAHTILDSLPAGQYDVRVEGDGIVTEVKRGVQVFSGRDGSLIAVVRAGEGAHVVEYATGGLAREEIAARIAKLEAALADLQKARQSK
jgi:hypothetical protein